MPLVKAIDLVSASKVSISNSSQRTFENKSIYGQTSWAQLLSIRMKVSFNIFWHFSWNIVPFGKYLTKTQISLTVLSVSHNNILQHAVRSLTVKLREWPWQWVTRALGCSTNNLLATPDFFPVILLVLLYVYPLQFWLNLNKISFIAFTVVTLFMFSNSQKLSKSSVTSKLSSTVRMEKENCYLLVMSV